MLGAQEKSATHPDDAPPVGKPGLEPGTSRTRTVRASHLRYSPNTHHYTPLAPKKQIRGPPPACHLPRRRSGRGTLSPGNSPFTRHINATGGPRASRDSCYRTANVGLIVVVVVVIAVVVVPIIIVIVPVIIVVI
jgi:hypothetical protein